LNYKKLYQVFGYIISAVFIYFFVTKVGEIDFSKIHNLLKLTDIFILLSLLFIGYAIRVLRWKILLESIGAKVSYRTLYANFIMCVGINNVLPFRVGDAYRVVGIKGLATKTQLFLSIVVERIMDVLALLLMFSLWLFLEKNTTEEAGIFLLVKIIAALAASMFLLWLTIKCLIAARAGIDGFPKWANSLMAIIEKMIGQSKMFFSRKVMRLAVPLSFLGWMPEILIFLYVAHGLGIDITFSMAALTHAFATLSTMVPSSPGFFGTYHYAVYYILSAYAIDRGLILLFAIVAHCLLWLPPIMVTFLLSIEKFFRQKKFAPGD
jgi:uncharacterized protein (TIRG00374 family)